MGPSFTSGAKDPYTWPFHMRLRVSSRLLPDGQVPRKEKTKSLYRVIVISIGRTVVNLQQGDKLQKDITCRRNLPHCSFVLMTWLQGNFYDDATWIVSEGPVSIVSICLPCIFSFAKRGIVEGPGALFRIGSDDSRQRARLPSDSEGAQLHILEPQSSMKTESSV